MVNQDITLRNYLTNDLYSFKRDFYQYLIEFINNNCNDYGKCDTTTIELFKYMMKRFKGGVTPMQLQEEINAL